MDDGNGGTGDPGVPPDGAAPPPPAPPPPPPPSASTPPPVTPLPFGPSSAAAGPPAPPSGTGWANPAVAPPAAGTPLPVYATDAPPPPPPGANAVKPRSRAALVILSVVAVLAASTFAFVALTRPDGAASPEAAVEQLFAALEQEDAIGVMEALPPGEREVLLEPMVATVGELQRLGLLDSFALEDVPGADIEVEGMTLQASNLADGITKVRVTGGTITGTIIPDQVPIGPRTREIAERNGGRPIEIQPDSSTESLADADLELVTVEEDGGWHVSLFYTLAESIRSDDTPVPPFGNGLAPVGGDTPEDAVRGLVQAGIDLDLGRAIGYLPPDEMRVLYDYGPLFAEQANRGAEQTRSEGYHASIDRLDLHAEAADDDSGAERVVIDGLDISGGNEDTTVRYTFDGSCTVMESSYRTHYFRSVGSAIDENGTITSTSRGGSGGGTSSGGYDDYDEEGHLTTTRFESCSDGTTKVVVDGEETAQDDRRYSGLNPFLLGQPDATVLQGVTVVEHDGRWYVSPVRTMFDSMLSSLRGLDGSEVDAYFDSLGLLFGRSSTATFEDVAPPIGSTPGGTYPAGTIPYQPDPDDPFWICSQEVATQIGPDPAPEEINTYQDQMERCLLEHSETPVDDEPYLGEPRIAGGHILVPANDAIVGYDTSGAVAWQGPPCEYGVWTGPDLDPTNTIEVARCDDDELVAVDATTGSELWRRPDDGSSTVSVGPRVVVVADAAGLTAIDLASGADLWIRSDLQATATGSDGERVYATSRSGTRAVDVVTGSDRWTEPTPGTGLGITTGVVVVSTDDGAMWRLDPTSGALRWSVDLDDGIEDGVQLTAVTDTFLVVAVVDDGGGMRLHDLATGELRTAYRDQSAAWPVATDRLIVATTDDDRLVAYDHDTGQPNPTVASVEDVWSYAAVDTLLAYVTGDENGDPVLRTMALP